MLEVAGIVRPPQGVLRLNWRELLFGEAAQIKLTPILRVMSVRLITS